MKKLSLLSAVVAATVVALPAASQTVWNMASDYPDSSYMTRNIKQFIQDFEAGTNGRYAVKLHNNQSLFKITEIQRAVATGQVELGEIHAASHANEDPMYVLDGVPFLADDYDKAKRLWHAQRPYFEKLLAKKNIRILYAAFWPLQGFFTKEPVAQMADLKGLKMRIYSDATRQMATRLGAQPIMLPFSDIPQAFGTGLINSLFTSPQTGIDIQAWDFSKHFNAVGAMRTKNFVAINEKVFQAMSPADQKILLDAAAKAEERGIKLSDESGREQLKILAEKGMKVTQASPEFLKELQDIGKAMIKEWSDAASPEHRAVLEAYQKQ